MAYVITEPCIGLVDTSCAAACPVDCIHPNLREDDVRHATILYVDPVACIDCSACMEVCPVEAPMLEADVPERWEPYVAINREFYDNGFEAAERMLRALLAERGGSGGR